MKAEPFLAPRINGKRFEQHSLPLEILKDFAVLEEMIVEVAKWRYRERHPDRKRIKRGFAKEISLHLTNVGEGSVVPHLALVMAAAGQLFPDETEQCFHEARDCIVNAIDAAERGERVTDQLPEEFLGYFNRIGRSLRADEAIEFAPNMSRKSRLTKDIRRQLVLSSSIDEFDEEVLLRGRIPEADQEKKSFDLQLADGSRVTAPMKDQFKKTVLEAFANYGNHVHVLLQGVGVLNRSSKLKRIEDVEHLALLDRNDIEVRVDELRKLSDGWLEGGGEAPTNAGLDWLVEQFDRRYPDELPLPYLFPTPEGGVQAEWVFNRIECSLEIDLVHYVADWHRLDLDSNLACEQVFDLSSSDGWDDLIKELIPLAENEGKK